MGSKLKIISTPMLTVLLILFGQSANAASGGSSENQVNLVASLATNDSTTIEKAIDEAFAGNDRNLALLLQSQSTKATREALRSRLEARSSR